MALPSDPGSSRDPDRDSGRPRIAVTCGDLGAAGVWKLLGEDPGLARFDLVLVGDGEVAGLGAEGFARRNGPGGAVLPGGLEEAGALAAARKVDAIAGALVAGEKAPVELLVRGERRVLPASREGLPALLVAASKAASAGLGIARPKMALCALDGADLEPAAEEARRAGVSLVGPLPAEDAFAARADLVCTLTRDQARLGLALAGREPTARLVLGAPFLRTSEDPAEKTARAFTLRASVLLAARLARARGELVSEREAREEEEKKARLSALAVSARTAREDRCPYCRRAFTDEEPGLRCASCETPHHRECIHEHGRCTVHGCGAAAVARGGVAIPVASLSGEPAARIPFATLLGEEGKESFLFLEAPIDAASSEPRRALAIELESAEVARGGRVTGALVVRAPRAFKASGMTFRLRAVLELRKPDERPRLQPIVEREALVLGDPSRGLLGRLSEGVASLLGTGEHLAIPAGTRRLYFSFRLRDDHPATVENSGRRSRGDVEIVTTTLEATLSPVSGGALSALVALDVR